jgi:sugar phosphate isomerase/epimerase
VPGGWLENLEVAAGLGWASGFELLLFSFEGEDRRLFLEERRDIVAIAKRAGIALSVHLPDPLLPAHGELVDLLAPDVECFIVHPPRDLTAAGPAAGAEWAGLISAWRRGAGDRFLLEYTEGSAFAAAEAALASLPLCADTGRLLLEGIDPSSWIAQRAGRIREIHLHGIEDGRDHRVPRAGEAWLADLLAFLRGYQGRVELELFSLDKVLAAKAALEASA